MALAGPEQCRCPPYETANGLVVVLSARRLHVRELVAAGLQWTHVRLTRRALASWKQGVHLQQVGLHRACFSRQMQPFRMLWATIILCAPTCAGAIQQDCTRSSSSGLLLLATRPGSLVDRRPGRAGASWSFHPCPLSPFGRPGSQRHAVLAGRGRRCTRASSVEDGWRPPCTTAGCCPNVEAVEGVARRCSPPNRGWRGTGHPGRGGKEGGQASLCGKPC